jgi:hypothetical protein
MFVGDEVLLDVGFPVARERLAQLAAGGALAGPSEDAYGREAADLARVGAAGVAKLVRVQVRELAWTDRSAGLAIRWEATGPGGGLFPVLDADIRLAPADPHVTVLTMAGVYRPPLGSLGEVLDRAILHRVAAATVRGFMARVATRITGGPGAAEAAAPNDTGASPPPDLPGLP